MSNLSFQIRKTGGFSLIEVLIAVLVLATGMLALAALQSALIRNSVDAKNRSQAMSIAVDTIERVRQNTGANITDYENLAVGQTAWTAWAAPAGVAGAGANYSANYESRQTVTRYVRESNQAVCGGVAKTPCFRVANAGEAPQEGVAEFKRVDIEVRWNDAQGNARSVSTSDIVGSVTDDKTSVILDQTGKPSVGIGEPVSRIPKPNEAGIIPIAVGDGKETAASNPKPITGRERGRTDETQFQVLTYSVEAGDVARLNRIIDTRVIGCRCTQVPATSVVDKTTLIGTPVQATYWNGTQYTAPEDVADINLDDRGAPVADAIQSQLCTTCCLDHHDRASNLVDFDPFRSKDDRSGEFPHQHFYDPDEVTNQKIEFAEAKTGDQYYEVCRMIRVDGIFRVATDMHLDLMNMLETDPSASESLPLASKIPRYQAMVKDFVDQRVVQEVAEPNLSAFSDVLVDPTEVKLGPDQLRYMHNRGLYIDHLEPQAVEALANALDECPSSKPKVDCALGVLPFVSINTTDIAQWGSQGILTQDATDDHISVTNWALRPNCPKNKPDCSPPPPARGATRAISGGTDTTLVSMQVSNSGVSDSFPIDPQDANFAPYTGQISSDAQTVVVDSSCTAVHSFKVHLVGGANFEVPQLAQMVNWFNPLQPDDACGTVSGAGCDGTPSNGQLSTANPFTCRTAFELPPKPAENELAINLKGYNRVVDPNSAAQADMIEVTGTCAGKSGKKKVGQYICEDWDVASVTLGSVTGTNIAQSISYDAFKGYYTIDAAHPGEGVSIVLKPNSVSNLNDVYVNFTLPAANRRKMGAYCDGAILVQPSCPLVP